MARWRDRGREKSIGRAAGIGIPALWPSLSLAVGKYFGDVVAANCFGT